ncbi:MULTISPECIES: glycosyltransferase [unclassified Pseudomonas]|uniref:glycosyltransferase n=1 Tax=unclassified Pseudomonas TaxID=196821 RepID=UPI0021C5B8BB|nr:MULTISPECIES: glycosyltransferase [unclassified Pseudomonas]MCU1735148.1 glycosyltransferase [Pseudomonas sp. 20P_3.2_Bac4]MCU1744528.1 glycosyltransferase [Pseudomonas sp. 20P_3.2_Bac5]
MNPAPLVSLVIPACNPRFFRAALVSALAQNYENLEVIVCDDSHGDEIKALVDELDPLARCPLYYQRNPQPPGLGANLLAGLELARGEYVQFLCDDDRLMADCISSEMRLFLANDDVSLVTTRRNLADGQDFALSQRLENSWFSWGATVYNGDDLLDFFDSNPLNFIGGFSNTLMRTSDLNELLPALVQAGFVALLDFALFICLLRRGNLVVTAQMHCIERIHPDQLRQQPQMVAARVAELQWLRSMLAARPPATESFTGWARIHVLPVDGRVVPRTWENLFLVHVLRGLQAIQESQVGFDSDTFADLYGKWLGCRQDPLVLRRLMRLSEHWDWRPRIAVVVIDAEGDSPALQRTVESINRQCYGAASTLVLSSARVASSLDDTLIGRPLQADWGQQLNELLPELEGVDWFYLLRAGDRLSEFSLMLLAERAVRLPQIACCYGDEGGLLEGESQDPVFKPDFNLDLQRAYPFTGRVLAFSRTQFLAAGGFAAGYRELAPHDLLWRLVESHGPQTIEHIPEVLVECAFGYAAWLSSAPVVAENPRVLQAHLQRLGLDYRLENEAGGAINQIRYLHAAQPLVTLIISFRDQVAALERCLESVLGKTTYPHYEVLVLDNASEREDSRVWLAAMAQMGGERLRVLSLDEETSFAAQQNLAAQHARGDYLLMLNPFTVVTDGDWLDVLLAHGQRPEVGMVGAELCNAEGLVVNAGGVLGLRGSVYSPFVGEMVQAGGYMQRLQVAQNYTVLSAECVLLRKHLFLELGGLNDARFNAAFSDVDLSLRMRQAGYLSVWTPRARLVLDTPPGPAPDPQKEAARQVVLAEQHEAFQRDWMPIIARDPAYNINLTLKGSAFRLEPGLKEGWLPFLGRSLPHVLALPMNKTAVGHYRVTKPLTELEAAGWVTQQQYFEIPTSVELERSSPDVVILQGRYTEGFIKEIERLKTYSKGFVIYELDDYVIKVPKKNGHLKHTPRDLEGSLRRGIARCDRLVVSTEPLADALRDTHHDIRVLPNLLAEELWVGRRGQRRTSKKPRVGWGGGTSHTGDLEVIADVVKTLANEVEWVFFGMCPPDLRPYIHEFHPPVGLSAYPAKLTSLNLDLALAPLEFHIFNDCKSNLRLLEYGACGYPVIVTDTAAYRGYLPCTRVKSNSTEEWLEAIRMHLADPDASYRMGDQLHDEVMRNYVLRPENIQVWYDGWMPS